MQATLLQVVQNYLDRTDGFYINDINDVDESLQAANIAERVFYHLYSLIRNAEFSTTVRTLDAVSDNTKPNYLKIPDTVHRIQDSSIYYNVADPDESVILEYKEVTYLTPQEFLANTKTVKSTDTNYDVITDYSGTKFSVQNNKDPEYFTSFDGKYLVFDSYNQNKDSTLQESKSRVWVSEEVSFLQQSDFVIPLPSEVIELYYDLVTVECYESLRQESAPPSVSRRARTGIIKLQQATRKVGSAGRLKKYGRKV